MKPSPEPPMKEAVAAAPQGRPGQPLLPKVFAKSAVLAEAICPPQDAPIPFIPFARLIEDIDKKCAELREQLREYRRAGEERQPHAIREAELVLLNAEKLLPALPAGQHSLAPDAVHELKYRAVDALLMLDAATRALQSP